MRIKLLGAVLLSGLCATGARTAPVAPGIANVVGNLTIRGGTIMLAPTFIATAGPEQTGSHTGLASGTIQSLTGGPVGFLPTPIVGFANFTTGFTTPLTFDLTYIAPGFGTLAGCLSSMLNSPCTPTGSPLTFFQLTPNTIIATFRLSGVAYSGSSATGTSPITSVFSTQTAITGTLPEIYGLLASGGAVSGISYIATFVTTGIPP